MPLHLQLALYGVVTVLNVGYALGFLLNGRPFAAILFGGLGVLTGWGFVNAASQTMPGVFG